MNRIYSAAIGFNERQLTPFLRSAAEFLQDFEVNLLVDAAMVGELTEMRTRYPFVRLHPVEKASRTLKAALYLRWVLLRGAKSFSRLERSRVQGQTWRHLVQALDPALARYLLIERLLEALPPGSEQDRIMLCDSRDVVFQKNAFDDLTGRLVTGAEPGQVGEKDRWIGITFGEEAQAELRGKQVICSGFTAGSLEGVRGYVSQIANEIWTRMPKVLFHRGLDQAMHIALIHRGKIQVTVCQNAEGKIATVALESGEHLAVDSQSGLIRVHNLVPSVLHQYDRHPAIAAHVAKRFSHS